MQAEVCLGLAPVLPTELAATKKAYQVPCFVPCSLLVHCQLTCPQFNCQMQAEVCLGLAPVLPTELAATKKAYQVHLVSFPVLC
jgi:hypothetical protein